MSEIILRLLQHLNLHCIFDGPSEQPTKTFARRYVGDGFSIWHDFAGHTLTINRYNDHKVGAILIHWSEIDGEVTRRINDYQIMPDERARLAPFVIGGQAERYGIARGVQ